jgi:hypothetical protein
VRFCTWTLHNATRTCLWKAMKLLDKHNANMKQRHASVWSRCQIEARHSACDSVLVQFFWPELTDLIERMIRE